MCTLFRSIVVLCTLVWCTAAEAQWRQRAVPPGTFVLKAAGNPTRPGALVLWTQSRPISDSSLTIWFTPSRFYESTDGGMKWNLVDSSVFRIIDQPPLQYADSPYDLLFVGEETVRSVFVQERVDLFTYYFEYRKGDGPFLRRSFRHSFGYDTGTPWVFLADREMIFNAYLRLDEPDDSSTFALMKSTNGGETWGFVPDSASGTIRLPRATTLAFRLRYPSVMFLGTVRGLFRSPNEGLTWDPVMTGSPIDAMTIRLIRVHPKEPSLVYIVGYGAASGDNLDHVYRTTDNGFHWEDVYSDTLVSDIATSEADARVALMNTASGLMLSTDRGGAWVNVHRNLPPQGQPYRVQWIHLDPAVPSMAYAATVTEVYVHDEILGLDPLMYSRQGIEFALYPNPCSRSRHSTVAVRYSLGESVPVTFALTDLLGRVLWKSDHVETHGGTNLTFVGVAEFGAVPAGVYFLSVRAPGIHRTAKLLIRE